MQLENFKKKLIFKKKNYKIIENVAPLIEEYKGINNVNYKHIYYIAKIDKYEDLKIDLTNHNQILEVNSIKWLSKNECLEKIRNYNKEKMNVIKQFFSFIENINDTNIKNI